MIPICFLVIEEEQKEESGRQDGNAILLTCLPKMVTALLFWRADLLQDDESKTGLLDCLSTKKTTSWSCGDFTLLFVNLYSHVCEMMHLDSGRTCQSSITSVKKIRCQRAYFVYSHAWMQEYTTHFLWFFICHQKLHKKSQSEVSQTSSLDSRKERWRMYQIEINLYFQSQIPRLAIEISSILCSI